MTDRIVVWIGEHAYFGWYDPNNDYVFLTRRVSDWNIEYIINHETLHRVLNNFINYEASFKLDNVDVTLWAFMR